MAVEGTGPIGGFGVLGSEMWTLTTKTGFCKGVLGLLEGSWDLATTVVNQETIVKHTYDAKHHLTYLTSYNL